MKVPDMNQVNGDKIDEEQYDSNSASQQEWDSCFSTNKANHLMQEIDKINCKYYLLLS